MKLAEALEDRASFRRVCGFAVREVTPERTAFVRFRRTLITQGLNRQLFDAVTAQLKARVITVKTGMLVYATIIASASKGDGEARWVEHRNRTSVHGFKAHVGADAETALVEQVSVAPANVHDGREGPAALPGDLGHVYADSAYRGQHFEAAVYAMARPRPRQSPGPFHRNRLQPQAKPQPPADVSAEPGKAHLPARTAGARHGPTHKTPKQSLLKASAHRCPSFSNGLGLRLSEAVSAPARDPQLSAAACPRIS